MFLEKYNSLIAFVLGHLLGFFNPFIVLPVYSYFNGNMEELVALMVSAGIVSSISDLGFTKYSNKWIAKGRKEIDVYWNTFVSRLFLGLCLLVLLSFIDFFSLSFEDILIMSLIHVQKISLNVPVLRKVGFNNFGVLLICTRLITILVVSYLDKIIIYWILDIVFILSFAIVKIPFSFRIGVLKENIVEASPIFVSNQFVFLKENTIIPYLLIAESPSTISSYYIVEKIIQGLRSVYKPINDYYMSLNQMKRLPYMLFSLLLLFIMINSLSFTSTFFFENWTGELATLTLLLSLSAFTSPIAAYISNSLILRSNPHYVRNSVILTGIVYVIFLFFLKDQLWILVVQNVVNIFLVLLLFRKYSFR